MSIHVIKRFLQLESASGILLFAMAILAMLLANSPLAPFQHWLSRAFLFTVNEGLMALFFLLVTLELKRGFLEGQLSSWSQILLPAVTALGGMVVPACVYLFFNHADPFTHQGWAIPVATDIAFALGVLTLFGKRIPIPLKLFLLALAIFDDLGAILIIVLFYSGQLAYLQLSVALMFVLLLFLLQKLSIRTLTPYLLAGFGLWFCLLHSGVHPTVAGVVLGLMVPATQNRSLSLLHRLETQLHPWVAYLIMPLFAFMNAGIPLRGMAWSIVTDPVVLGVTLGLFIGKQVGVMGSAWLLIKMRLAKLPEHASWLTFYGVAVLCGIGFTMSLFLGTLSFAHEASYLTEVRLGVMLGSLLSCIMGTVILQYAFIYKRSNGVE